MLVLVCFRRWRLLFCFFLFSFFLRFFIFRIFFHIFSTRIANPLAGYIACTPASTNAAWTFTFGIGTFTGAFFWIHFLKNYKIYVLENGYRCIMNFSNLYIIISKKISYWCVHEVYLNNYSFKWYCSNKSDIISWWNKVTEDKERFCSLSWHIVGYKIQIYKWISSYYLQLLATFF